MEIKHLQIDEKWGLVRCGAPTGDLESRLRQFLEYRHACPEDIVALEQGCCIGRLCGAILPNELYEINSIFVEDTEDFGKVGGALLEHVLKNNSNRQVEAVNWARAEDANFDGLLRQWGFFIYSQKVFVQCILTDFRNPYQDIFTYRNFLEEGREAFITAIAKINADSLDSSLTSADPATELNELIEQADSAFDGSHWQLAFVNGELAGLVFPQLYIESPHEGTLFHVGVTPEYRGRGWGKILHAKGLEELRKAGAVQYVGCTDIGNSPMLRVFEVNGCEQKGVRRIYRLG